MFRTTDYNYHLPPELIAQMPRAERDTSRLLVLNRLNQSIEHRHFRDLLSFLRPGDVLVVNNSKVIPARLRALKRGSGGAIEALLVEENGINDWWAMLKPGKRVRAGTVLCFNDVSGEATPIEAEVREKSQEGHYRLTFQNTSDVKRELDTLGEIPLPPYITRASGPIADDSVRYQTVFAKPPGSVAAPTAGLHFTPALLSLVKEQGIEIAEVTLHVGLGTFAPVKTESLKEHIMHEERYMVSDSSAAAISRAKAGGGRVVAVGTTSIRVLESVAAHHGKVVAASGKTRLFVHPPYHFKVVDALVTNFHLPESTLLMLVSAFAAPDSTDGRQLILNTYAEAVRQRYRFFSYGDAMLIL